MSRLPGRVEWWPPDTGRWLRRLAELLPRIHAAPLPASGTLRRFAPHTQDSYQPPGWTRQPRLWERAAEISHGPAPDLPAVLVHRDFHPGNVLWQRGAVTGVVDWQAACTGPAVADIGHCRINRPQRLHLDFGLVRDPGLADGLGFRLGFPLDAGGLLASGFPVE
jgi:Ser/Thr protein kinase RdoA (MazF antagonist)